MFFFQYRLTWVVLYKGPLNRLMLLFGPVNLVTSVTDIKSITSCRVVAQMCVVRWNLRHPSATKNRNRQQRRLKKTMYDFHLFVSKCFDTVGWAAGRASSL